MTINLTINTSQSKEVVDITNKVNELLPQEKKGWCYIFVKHTTAALSTADLDPGTDQDMLDAFQKIIPKLNYRHPHDPDHVPDHILSTLIGTSLTVPYDHKGLKLGQWQRLVLFEFSGPRKRELEIGIFE